MGLRIADDDGNEYELQGETRLVKVEGDTTQSVTPSDPEPPPADPGPPVDPEPPPADPEPPDDPGPPPVDPEPPPVEPDPPPIGTVRALDRLLYCGWGTHEALPEGGNPGWDWYRNGRGGTGIQGGHVNVWGQVFAVAGTPTYDVDVELRNARMFFLRRDGRWYEPVPVTNPVVEGSYWNGRFQGVGSAPVTKIGDFYRVPLKRLVEPDAVTFHWWHKAFYPRVTVPSDVVGVCNMAEARLSGPNATRARMICSVGGDVWPVPTGGKPAGTQVSAMCQPRMTHLTDRWQLFGGVSYPKGSTDKPITRAMLRANPPPLDWVRSTPPA